MHTIPSCIECCVIFTEKENTEHCDAFGAFSKLTYCLLSIRESVIHKQMQRQTSGSVDCRKCGIIVLNPWLKSDS